MNYQLDLRKYKTRPTPTYTNMCVENIDVARLKKFWERAYKPGRRNKLVLALAGQCRQNGISEQDAQKLLITLNSHVGEAYDQCLKEIKYSYNIDSNKVAVWHFFKELWGGAVA